MRSVCVPLLTWLLCFALPARAEAPGDVPVALTLEAAIARAESRSPLVRRARGEVEVARSLRVGAGQSLPQNPYLAVSAGKRFDRSGSAPAASGFEWGLHLEQAFEIGGQRSARLDEADRGIDAAAARARFAEAETRAEVRAAYLGAQLFRAHVEAAKRREGLAGQVLESARAKMMAGAASEVDLNLAASERGRVAHERIEAEIQEAEEDAALRLLLDYPEGTVLALSTPLALPGEPEDAARLVDAARRRREDLRALAAVRARIDATVVRLRRENVPNPSLFGDVSQAAPGQTYLGGGAAIGIPVFRRNQGPIAQANAERARIEEELRLTDRELTAEIHRMHRMLAQRRAEARIWAEDVVPTAEQNLSLVTEGWHAGKFDLYRVVQAAREAGEARRKQLEVLGSLWQVAIDLDRATGAR